MRFAYFTHSLVSCWNHGNAHFVRGVLRALIAGGHQVAALEPQDAWSRTNLLADEGEAGLAPFSQFYPELNARIYATTEAALAAAAEAEIVIVHEWNDPSMVAALGRLRARGAKFRLFFHDTHHRAVSDPAAMRQFDLSGYDGILAFGAALAEIYRGWGWADRVFVWHEAADLGLFTPPAQDLPRSGLVWVGNWGDGERAAELTEFLLEPARQSALPLDIYGVRYPATALEALHRHGAQYHNWLANPHVPAVFARHLATVHVPRGHYVQSLPGIPTIRVFEALACGIPLVCAPWHDAEGLFRPGADYLTARDGAEMTRHLRALAADPDLRAALIGSGLQTIRARHSCAHRAEELLAIVAKIGRAASVGAT